MSAKNFMMASTMGDMADTSHEHAASINNGPAIAAMLAAEAGSEHDRVAPHGDDIAYLNQKGVCGSSSCVEPGCAHTRQYVATALRHL